MMLTRTLKDLSSQGNIEPQLIIRIDGIPFLFGAIGVEELLRFDKGYLFDDGLFFDSTIVAPESKDVIQIQGTTTNLTQQVNIDKGGTNTIQRMTVKMIDEFSEISDIFSSGQNVPEILGRTCEIFISFKGASFPQDAIRIIKGFIDDVAFGAGFVTIGCSQSDKYKSQTVFNPLTTLLSSTIDDSVTGIPLDEPEIFFNPQDVFKSYTVIEDEICEVIEVNNTTIDVIRGRFNTATESHDIDTEVQAAFSIEGNAIDLALKLMLSKADPLPVNGEVTFVTITPEVTFSNAVFIPYNVTVLRGVTVGDILIVNGSAANDGEYLIEEIVILEDGCYIRVDGEFLAETGEDILKVRSKYDVLPIGLKMTVDDVDVLGHEQERDFFGTNLVDMFFYIDDELDGKEFIEEQLYRPLGLYGVVRFGRSSVKSTRAAITNENTIELNTENVINVNQIKTQRSVNKYYYNTIFYKYGKNVAGKYLVTDITTNNTSAELFKIGTKQLSIEADGYRRSTDTTSIIRQQANRFLGRYAFAPRYIDGVQILFADGFNIEVGDTVILDGEDLKLKDILNPGNFMPKTIFEVVNKSMNFFTGNIKLDLLETNFKLDSRYGVFAPTGEIVGASGNEIDLENAFLSDEFETQADKFRPFIGNAVRIYNDDYSFDVEAVLVGINELKTQTLILDADYSIPSGCCIDLADYMSASIDAKNRFTYMSDFVEVWDVVPGNDFALEVLDLKSFYIGQKVEISNFDYQDNLFIETVITDITTDGGVLILYFEDDISTLTMRFNINALEFVPGENVYRYY
jgi:hypothetical protein